jgi:hypothetical protein
LEFSRRCLVKIKVGTRNDKGLIWSLWNAW